MGLCQVLKSKTGLNLVLILLTIGCTSTAIAWAIVVRLRLLDFQANMTRDPERTFMDECLRDFEGVAKSDADYRAKHKACIEELDGKDVFKQLPRIRPVVDEGVCTPTYLCSDSDPGQCNDRGDEFAVSFTPGDVTRCFQLIERARTERVQATQWRLMNESHATCTRPGRWDNYEKVVWLEYCMWKQMQHGACTNDLRTNCPSDSSCCPAAQKHLSPEDRAQMPRQDKYVCRKSPVVGLHCLHVDFRATSNSTTASVGDFCSMESCPDFAWCRDFADIPGLCLGEPCKDYQRALAFSVACVTITAVALALDLLGLVFFIIWGSYPKPLTMTNFTAFSIKVVGLCACLASGSEELVAAVGDHACFVGEGAKLAPNAQTAIGAFITSSITAACASLCLAPMAMRCTSPVGAMPYAHVS